MSLYYHKHQFIPLDRILELYFVGCTQGCRNCHNSFLKERNEFVTRKVSVTEVLNELKDYIDVTTQVHILGGEPLEQNLDELSELLKGLKELGFRNIVLFTGKNLTQQEINEKMWLFQHCDYLKIGNYDESQLNQEGDISILGFPLASKNQKIIQIK